MSQAEHSPREYVNGYMNVVECPKETILGDTSLPRLQTLKAVGVNSAPIEGRLKSWQLEHKPSTALA